MTPATIVLLIVVDVVLLTWAVRNLMTLHRSRFRRRR
jgi:hypothetical protein